MGDKAAGDHIAVPLTEEVRADIVAQLDRLPESVRGDDVSQLVGMVESALIVDDDDLAVAPENNNFGPHTPESDRALDQLCAALAVVIPAARTITSLLPPQDAAQLGHWREKHPWADELDHVAPALMRFGIPADDLVIPAAQRKLQDAVTAVTSLFAGAGNDLQRMGNNKGPRAIRWVVRACACYRVEQGITNTSLWNPQSTYDRQELKGKGNLEPVTDYDRLLVETCLVFGFREANSALRYEANGYRILLKHLRRPPARSDFDNPFRTLIG
ncbi:hypothetical protein [Sphingomonas oryzagri]